MGCNCSGVHGCGGRRSGRYTDTLEPDGLACVLEAPQSGDGPENRFGCSYMNVRHGGAGYYGMTRSSLTVMEPRQMQDTASYVRHQVYYIT